jgi:hypothetical protein
MAKFQEYRIRDFLKKDETGLLTNVEIRRLSEDIIAAAAKLPRHNFLLDLRHTTVEENSLAQVLEMASELGLFATRVQSKVANLIPADGNRMSQAKVMENSLRSQGLNYRVFSDYEEAIEWLAAKSDSNHEK